MRDLENLDDRLLAELVPLFMWLVDLYQLNQDCDDGDRVYLCAECVALAINTIQLNNTNALGFKGVISGE